MSVLVALKPVSEMSHLLASSSAMLTWLARYGGQKVEDWELLGMGMGSREGGMGCGREGSWGVGTGRGTCRAQRTAS